MAHRPSLCRQKRTEAFQGSSATWLAFSYGNQGSQMPWVVIHSERIFLVLNDAKDTLHASPSSVWI